MPNSTRTCNFVWTEYWDCAIRLKKFFKNFYSQNPLFTVDLASKNPRVAALILHSPLLSGMRVAFHGIQRTWCCDAFPSIEKIPRVSCPTLVIHGTENDVI